ncbi:hypothetical protein D3C71_2081280 [compost metagenome]
MGIHNGRARIFGKGTQGNINAVVVVQYGADACQFLRLVILMNMDSAWKQNSFDLGAGSKRPRGKG